MNDVLAFAGNVIVVEEPLADSWRQRNRAVC